MNKKTFLILIIAIVFLGAVGFFVLLNQNQVPRVEIEETQDPEFIPFSESGNRVGQEEDNNENITNSINLNDRASVTDFVADDTRLTKVSDRPVAGFTLFSKLVEIIEEPEVDTDESLVESYNFFDFETMRIGDSGEGVAALQSVLNRLYEDINLVASGNFETDTKNAVLQFQSDNNLTADGIVGNASKKKLNELQGLSDNPQDFEVNVRTEERFTIRYQDKLNGSVYDLGVDVREFEQVSNTTFSVIYESFFGNNGDTVVVRYENDGSIQTFIGDIVEVETDEGVEVVETPGYIDGTFLPEGIPFVSVSPDGSNLLYFQTFLTRSQGSILDLESKEGQIVFESSFKEWLPQFNGDDSFSLTSRASALSEGFSYVYNANEFNDFRKGVGGYTGLTTNYNPTGSKVLYSINEGRFVETYVYDFEDKTNLLLGFKTLAEKCVWKNEDDVLCAVPRFISPEEYPDAWYKGEVLFQDRLWDIDTENGREEIVSNLQTPENDMIDATRLEYKNGILLFQNKYDHTLWMIDMRNQ